MVSSLDVYLNTTHKQKVGILAQKDKKIYFEYDKEFLKTGLQLSPYKLPLKPGLFTCEDDTFGGIWGVFADSLPDGWGQLLLERHFIKHGINPNTLTPLDKLALIGDDAMGALSYEPSQPLPGEFEDIILDDLAKNSQEILQGESDELVEKLLSLNGSSAGARPKVLVQMSDDLQHIAHSKLPLKEGYSHWIVKFASSTDSKEIGAIEYAYSLMAKEAGLDMPQTALLKTTKGRYFAIKRFDRIGSQRVHMHSVAGLVHSDFRFPTLDYDDLLGLTMHFTKDIKEVQKLFRLACLNLFAHNRDDHAKNFSFLMDANGKWRLSPVYDLTFSFGPNGEHSTMYMGEGRNPTVEHLRELAQKHHIKNGSAIIEETHEIVKRFKEFADIAGLSKKSVKTIENSFVL